MTSMQESYLIPRAEDFSAEKALALVLHTRLEQLLGLYAPEPATGEEDDFSVLEDIPVTDEWSLDIYKAGPYSLYANNIENRNCAPLDSPIVLRLWLRGPEDLPYRERYTFASGGDTAPIIVGSNGAYDMDTKKLLEPKQLDALLTDVETVVVPYLAGQASADS